MQVRHKKPPKTKKKLTKKSKIRKIIFRFLILCMVWGILLLGLIVLWFSQDLPDLSNLQTGVRTPSITIQTQDGVVIGSYGDLFEEMVKAEDLPAYVPQALMAVEDRRFYYHFGVDIIGLVRAAYQNYRAKRVVQGGSTLTQQLAKNFLVSEGSFTMRDRSLKRKIQEVLLAVWLEWKFSKNQILTMYLNRVYFGSGTYGIEAAAQKYFNKSARQLSVCEAAVIAGVLRAPSKYSPAANPKKAIARAKVVLDLMVEAGFIKDSADYLQQGMQAVEKNQDNPGYKYFCDWVYETLPNLVDVTANDLIVVVTLDHQMQQHAEKVCAEHFAKMSKELKTSQYSFVAMTPDGGVKSLVGGKDYRASQFNRVTHALRQPGSAFKMFIYLAAIESGIGILDEIDDGPIVIGNWRPSNYKWISKGTITVQEAFAKSVNSVAIRLAQQVTPAKIIQVARKLGITSELQDNISIALGSLEVTLLDLTAAFATFANDGRAVWPYGILEVRDKSGNILYQRSDKLNTVIVKPENVEKMKSLLQAVVTQGSGRALAGVGSKVYGKTGSNGDKDAWFIGFREYVEEEKGYSNIVTGFWTGNDNNKPMAKQSTGSKLPAKATAGFFGKNITSAVPSKKVNNPPSQPKATIDDVLNSLN